MAPNAPTAMTYRFLGNSGLLVSKLGLGGWMFYDKAHTTANWYDVMKTAFKHGVNYFDSAENYCGGQSERQIGEAIQKGIADGVWAREDLVISTKIFIGQNGFLSTPNAQGAGRKHLVEGVKRSLQRLQLDYIDVVSTHLPETSTPIEETVRAMNFVIDQGWAIYWGLSGCSAANIGEAFAIADRLGLARPIVEQPKYSILDRTQVEYELADLCRERQLGLAVYSPLEMGILTGKYEAEGTEDPNARLNQQSAFRSLFRDQEFGDKVRKANQLKEIAEEVGCSLPQLALAWCLSNEHVSTILVGAKSSAQFEESVQALRFEKSMTPDIMAKIDAIVQFTPKRKGIGMQALRGRFLQGTPVQEPGWATAMRGVKPDSE
jgi:voltage-dependent potassium channel beta subunit